MTKNDEQKKNNDFVRNTYSSIDKIEFEDRDYFFFYAYLFYLHVSKAMKMNDRTMNMRSSVHANVEQSTNEDIMH